MKKIFMLGILLGSCHVAFAAQTQDKPKFDWTLYNNFPLSNIYLKAEDGLKISPANNFVIDEKSNRKLKISTLTDNNDMIIAAYAAESSGMWAMHYYGEGDKVTLRVMGKGLAITWNNLERVIFFCDSSSYSQKKTCRTDGQHQNDESVSV
ncbi:MAG: hypothetical protein K0S08_840 [Gammaproteobacteria bacterium]|jgi:hypothetical protein|nr:hypothetical protein [Gammaproteobacteria bacterium]